MKMKKVIPEIKFILINLQKNEEINLIRKIKIKKEMSKNIKNNKNNFFRIYF